jgi:hypothetical protein
MGTSSGQEVSIVTEANSMVVQIPIWTAASW